MRIAVIGAGPAGVAAAVFLKRCNIDTVVFEKDQIGGLIKNAWRVENIPFLPACSGEKIAEILEKSLKDFSIPVIFKEVMQVSGNIITTRSGSERFDKILVATGTVPKRIKDFEVDQRVVYQFKDLPKAITDLAIYGAGDAAFDGALKALENGIPRIHIFNRTDKIKAIARLQKLVFESSIVYHGNEAIVQVKSQDKLTIKTVKDFYRFDALLICAGRTPNTALVKDITEDIHIIGDAKGGYRQMSIAVGNAIETAMKIAEEIK